jgi:hypothetical protein
MPVSGDSMTFEILYFPLVFLGSLTGFKCSQVSAFSGFWVCFAGVKPVFPGF